MTVRRCKHRAVRLFQEHLDEILCENNVYSRLVGVCLLVLFENTGLWRLFSGVDNSACRKVVQHPQKT